MVPTPSPAIRVFPDANACAAAAAETFLALSLEATENHKTFRVALSGGSTPKRLYALLAEAPFRDKMPWSKIHFFFSDERHVGPDHPDSNFGSARDGLFEKVAVPGANIHRIFAERPDAGEVAAVYQNTIAASFGGHAEMPAFDLIFLGMGPDGHTASLFPGTPALQEKQRWVIENPVEKLKTERITFTYPLINQAARVLLLVTGEDKAERIGEIFNPAPNKAIPTYPVQGVQPVKGLLEWYLDEAAAKHLKREPAPAAAPIVAAAAA